MLSGLQNRSERYDEEKYALPLSGIEPQSSSLFTVLTELPGSLKDKYDESTDKNTAVFWSADISNPFEFN
jgi:hypothetical protein